MFTDEDIGDLSFESRWLFAGLFTQADREGRLEDRPRKLKVEVMPYDDVSIEDLLRELTEARFITRYQVEGKRYIQIRTFHKHQQPHHKERDSVIPPDPNALQDSSKTQARLKQESRESVLAHGEREGDLGREGNGEREASLNEDRTRSKRSQLNSALSDSFLNKIQAKPVYSHIEVRHVYAKMLAWCEVKGKDVTEDRLINWLNREIPGNGNAKHRTSTKEKIERVVQNLVADHSLDETPRGSS
jgi:hypothetical protein